MVWFIPHLGYLLMKCWNRRLIMELDLSRLLGLLCTAVLIGWDTATPPPPLLRIWTHIRGRYWTAKIDDISLSTPDSNVLAYLQGTPVNRGVGDCARTREGKHAVVGEASHTCTFILPSQRTRQIKTSFYSWLLCFFQNYLWLLTSPFDF